MSRAVPGGRYTGPKAKLQRAGAERTVTVTYRYGGVLVSLVAPSRVAANAEARKRWGQWDGDPCYSTPISIYNDLTGTTERRKTRQGMYPDGTL